MSVHATFDGIIKHYITINHIPFLSRHVSIFRWTWSGFVTLETYHIVYVFNVKCLMFAAVGALGESSCLNVLRDASWNKNKNAALMAQVVEDVLVSVHFVQSVYFICHSLQTVPHAHLDSPSLAHTWPQRVPINAFLSVHKF